ncbi:unnamed protein product [Sphagnum balticum]
MNGRYLQTSVREGWLTVWVQDIPRDEDYYPLIPTDEHVQEAVYRYCRMMLIEAGYEDKVFNHNMAVAAWDKASGQAISAMTFPTPGQGSYPYGKNGIWNANINAEENENGFLQSNVNTPYPIIGVIETDTYPLYFSTDNTNSAFGFHNTDTDSYNAVFDDATLSFKLGFSTARPIKGEYRRNFRNEIELTWIELGTGANPPRWANTNNIGSDLNDFLLFPKCLIPYIDTTLQPGGNLSMGAYFFGAKYISNDGTETRYTTLTRPLIAFSDNYDTIPGTNTGKAITLNVTGIDLTYDRLGLVVVERINGVDTPYELPDQAIAPNITFVYTGAEKSTQLTMDEVLIPSAYYENAQAISQLTDQLFLANMTEETVIDWQQYANMVTIRWKSELVNVASRPNIPTESGKQRGWMHSEVGAFYIVLKLRTGRNSRAFTIPGPAPLSSDLLQSAYATAQGLTAAVYQIEDTCRNLQSDNTGDCGIWINNDESYPDIIQFDSTSIGGENLRGQPVRHHRMPSLRFCKTNLYGSQPEYGRTMLDTIGLEVTNVIIPSDLQDQVIGWELHYAERNFNNAMVLGQSLLMFGAQANSNAAGGGGITSTGGNWGSWQRTHGSGAITDPESLKLVNNYIRFHAFDLLYFRPSITPSYIDLQLGMVANFTGGANIAYDKSDEVLMDVDYTNGQNNISVPATRPDNEHIYAIEDGQYVINNGNSGDYMNTRLEEAFVAKLPTPGTNLMNSLGWGYMKRDYDKGDVACRYETPGNDYSQFWPKSSMANGTNSFLYNFSRSVEPNQIGYSRDCNSVGDLLNGILIASPYDQFVQQSPTKIVRSEKQAYYTSSERTLSYQKYQLFKGINSSAFNCNAAQYPVLGNYNFTSNEHVPNGTVIGTVAATGGILPYTYLIVTANRAGLGIDPLTGIITVIDTTAFDYTQSVLSLQVRVIDNAGSTATGNVNVTINHVASVPVLPAYNVTIPEHSPNGTVVNTEVATDRDGKSITYSITGGNGAGAFAINATTGIVTVVNGTILDYFSTNPYTLTIRATASDGSYDENTLTIGLSFVHQPPIVTNDTFSVIDTAVNGTVVGTITPATQRTGQSGYLVYALVTDSVPAGAFQVITDEDDVNYLNALVLSNTLLDPLNNVYVITMEVYDPSFPADISNFTVFQAGTPYAYNETVFADEPSSPDCVRYTNNYQHQVFTRNNCATGLAGTTVDYQVPAGTYTSSVSQADADNQALADIAANGQNYANANGSCLTQSLESTLLVDYYADTTADLCAYLLTPGFAESGQIVAPPENGGPQQLPNDGRDPAACYLLFSNKLSGPPVRRAGINLAYFIAKYPGTDVFTFRLQGRGSAALAITGIYAMRAVNMGYLTMITFGGSGGGLIPSVSGATTADIVGYSSHIEAGTDGTVGTCYEFDEVPGAQLTDNSFTLSMALEPDTMKSQGWVFFHDYFPDMYVHTRDKLINLKNSRPFYQSKGPKGIYHFNTDPKPFFIDVLFSGLPALNEAPSSRYQQSYRPWPSLILNSVNWISEVRNSGNDPVDDNQRALYLETITAITIWNQYQTTGRIALDQGISGLTSENNRNSEETWNFNEFRNILDNLTDQFIEDIFHDYQMDVTKLNTNLPWWEQRLMEGKYFIIRFEFDNNNNKQITIHDVDADISKSYR